MAPGHINMLVLSRKVGEKILIGDNIAVTVVRVAQGIVRIGVDAPKSLSIVRDEIKERADGDGRESLVKPRPVVVDPVVVDRSTSGR